jgi:hypothetical protein
MKTMKTTIYIITTLLTLSFTSLYASGTELPAKYIIAAELAPSLPVEATFEESTLLIELLPVIPAEAEFNDSI